MFLLVKKMYPSSSINVLRPEQQDLLKRCCKFQLPLIAAGTDTDSTVKALCDLIAKDQIPSVIGFSNLEDFEFPEDALVVEIYRINDSAPHAGVFPDDWEDRLFNVGSFYLNGKKI